MKKGLLVSALACAFLMVAAQAAGAATNAVCAGALGAGSYQRVTVPAGAACFSDGPVVISDGLYVGAGATFVLGSEENAVPTGWISGGVHAAGAASVQIHFSTINGGVDIRGGAGPFGGPFGITWSTIEDSTINGRTTVAGYDGFWFGFIRNHVNGSVNLVGNVSTQDDDSNEVVSNTINGGLACTANAPAPQVGDSAGSTNKVTGRESGQCAGL